MGQQKFRDFVDDAASVRRIDFESSPVKVQRTSDFETCPAYPGVYAPGSPSHSEF